ncbi:hypothetical protein J7E50_09780 [Pedobacter sp. ISL-68]|uniref:hypothetical protein n=1 Tax=unclassified Pedobacter TaxID=2628915 RepID=UPI001BE540DE|nr:MULTISPECIES: hypothetical protein [unclassified Pedobacter]MBT2561119.1 hypothetical protein [Pedobacter sp. ISL-64]MBT2590508.1 hypothetical protein [Pedobacter sp. ISL-68]
MKATTQYTDFKGTAAADISDHYDLEAFLKSRGVDTNRYEAIGAEFYHGEGDFFSATIICLDNENSTKENPYISNLSFESGVKYDEFFGLFKRFNVILTKKYGGYEENEIKENVTVDDTNHNQ